LKEWNALRLVSREPSLLAKLFPSIFDKELLEASSLLGLSLSLQNPVKARLILTAKSAQAAQELANRIRNEPQRLLKVQDSELLLHAQPPAVEVDGANVELRFDVPENSARLLLHRLAKTSPAPAIAEN
jgi:hypothetical protein